MKKISLSLISAGALAAALYLGLSGGPAVNARPAPTKTIATKKRGGRGLASVAAEPAVLQAEASLEEKPLEPQEKESVKTFLQLLSNYQGFNNAKDLAGELKAAKLNPVIARDSNKDTGELAMVRTEDALPGTRYFHAQVFENGQGQSHAQHLSFEIRPGKDSMEVATSLIKQTFRDLGTPLMQRDDYVMWRNREGRIVSAKRMGLEDLRDNYFNAHSPEDIGTIWVTSEDDPEEAEES
ncbi:MAG: hypothetical protein EOP11_17395 [Proteobacteria bacterium]|nr:MAG: hypothetical protein EOP11_17395 [Pseudomonadota bacterium]